MKKKLINTIEQGMLGILNNEQLAKLHEVLEASFALLTKDSGDTQQSNDELLKLFLSAKQVEGCSEKTLKYYRTTLSKMITKINKSIRQVETNDIRSYISNYENISNAGKVTLDNIRRIISSFFAWLEDENYIVKSPARRIHKIRTGKTVKDVYSDEELEQMRDSCTNSRDLAIIDILASTGIRVGELVNLNINDVDFEKRECVVLGKGNKQRKVYFDARTKIHLYEYVANRHDKTNALFVSLNNPHNRLSIRGIETILHKIGSNLKSTKVHPHKFRRTLATKAIDKGMPIEQVQVLLGHSQIDTTLRYAMVNQNNVKASHHKYIG
ncbi:site-specific tyrosine recombinase/integron integrase [Veillonella sp. VA137]|uniref:site-specific tyrosine recombinase/integron integrase n=1 Tax=Veillonella sp. VA137 TaxID=741828 RepID=UPI000F8C50C2|nr:site-specific tyrosine recombinase/integron integrase [Veillonella sp. VA137]